MTRFKLKTWILMLKALSFTTPVLVAINFKSLQNKLNRGWTSRNVQAVHQPSKSYTTKRATRNTKPLPRKCVPSDRNFIFYSILFQQETNLLLYVQPFIVYKQFLALIIQEGMSEGQPILSLPLEQMYKVVGRIVDNGMNQYPIMKKYHEKSLEQKSKSMKSISRKLPLIGKKNYLDDQAKIHNNIPGPGQYNLQLSKCKATIPFKINKQIQKKTYLDEIIQINRKSKSPGPGQYDPSDMIYQRKSHSSKKKINNPERQNYLTEVEYSASRLPGVGLYDVAKILKTDFNRKLPSPQKQIAKHKKRVLSQKKLKKLNPIPDMGTYDPSPSSYRVFSAMNFQKPKKHGFGKVQRFKTENEGSGLLPEKYGNIQKWVHHKLMHSYQKKGMDCLSKGNKKNIYY